MRKVILVVCFVFGATQLANAQLDFGIKAGVNYNTESIKGIKDAETKLFKSKGKLGYHAGIWLRAKVPVLGLYVRPEVVYTALNSEVEAKFIGVTLAKADYGFQKIDVPVLIGKKFAKIIYLHAGPSFQYVLNGDFKFNEDAYNNFVKEVDVKGFSVGLQFGGGIELGSLGIDVRWERGLSDIETKLVSSAGTNSPKFDTRVNQIIFGLSYKF